MRCIDWKNLGLILFFGLVFQCAIAQQNGPTHQATIELVAKVSSLAEQLEQGSFIIEKYEAGSREVNPKRRGSNKVVPGKGLPKHGDPLVKPDQKASERVAQTEPLRVFDVHISSNADPIPSDPTGAVGPNHYIAAWNTAFQVFDKQGNALSPPASLGTLFEGNTAGDPIVLYDAAADRFIITQFENDEEGEAFTNGLNIAISQGPDPLNSDWYVYSAGFETGALPDYPKYSIWSDGYYITSNIVTNPSRDPAATGDNVFVMQRDSLLVGNSAGFMSFALPGLERSNFYSPQFFNVGYNDLPPGGASLVYLQDDSWQGIEEDHLKLWTLDVDWENPENSQVSAPQILPTTPFQSVFDGGSFENLSQPSGPDIDVLQATIMNQAQFRAFPEYNSAVFNFVVDVAEGEEEQAGIRWYELRQQSAGENWSIFQEGTYVSPDGQNAFAASMVQDRNANIGMGFSTVNTENQIAIQYTGRYENDPLGIMSVPQTLLAQSTSNNPFSRYADYTHMTLDPEDEATMWFISEYFNPELRDVVGVFKLEPELANDVQLSQILSPTQGTLTASESITVVVRNAGTQNQSNFEVSYRVDNEPLVTETFTGSLGFNEMATFTFDQTADFSNDGQLYTIQAQTMLEADQNSSNDSLSVEVLHIPGRDVGIAAITNPISQGGQTDSEPVTVRLVNFGGFAQQDIPVQYQINDASPVEEVVSDRLETGDSITYTFNATADLSELGDYVVNARSNLQDDARPQNDTLSKIIRNFYCSPVSNCQDYNDGVTQISFGEQSLQTQCGPDGYADNTETGFEIDINESSLASGSLEMGFEDSAYAIFVDFNNNGAFEDAELVASGSVSQADTPETFSFNIPENVALGTYRMRVRGKDADQGGDLLDPCGFLEFGRTNDLSLTIFDSSIVRGIKLEEGELIVLSQPEDQFEVLLRDSGFERDMILNVFNISGQKLVQNRIEPQNGNYIYDLDMSYVSSGIYIIRIGTENEGLVKKIFVP